MRRPTSFLLPVLLLLTLAACDSAMRPPFDEPDQGNTLPAIANPCELPEQQIVSGGPGKDGIPSIDNPMIIAADRAGDLTPEEPVISLSITGEARAWPLRYLIWHEIVNDELGGGTDCGHLLPALQRHAGF